MAASVEECEKLEADIRKRDAELRQLRAQEVSLLIVYNAHASQPPLRQNEEEYARLTSDRTKFIAFLELHRQRVAKIKQQIQLTLAAKEENRRCWYREDSNPLESETLRQPERNWSTQRPLSLHRICHQMKSTA